MAVAEQNKESRQSSEPDSIEELFTAHESALLLYARKLTGAEEAAQDIVQEAFLRLHSQFETVRQPRSWLFRTVHNLAMNYHRAEKKIISIDPVEKTDREEWVDPEPWPDAQIERMEAAGQTRLCLEMLDDRSRELIRLKFEEGLSYKEISVRTGLTVSNVGYILHHSLKSLAAKLEKSGIYL